MREIEAASLRAWPALEEARLEEWTLRFSDGFTKRANSVQPAPGSKTPLADRVDECEGSYGARQRPCIFRVTPFSETGLDDYLAGRGYVLVEPTAVMERPTSSVRAGDVRAEVRPATLGEWSDTYARLSGMPDGPPVALGRIVGRIASPFLLAVLSAPGSGRPVACGLTVLDAGLCGLFDLVVEPAERGRGYGTELVRHLIDWGLKRGARRAYLQVTRENVAAMSLYERLGFRHVYEYWYRVLAG